MIDSTDLLSLEVAARDHVNEVDPALWTADAARRAINAEYGRLCRKIIDLDAGYFEVSKTYTPVASLTLPVNCYAVRNVEAYYDSLWYPVNWINSHVKEYYQTVGAVSSPIPLACRFAEDTLEFDGTLTNISSIRVTYSRAPVHLQSLTAASGAATTVTFSDGSLHDDVYIGDRLVITSGTGIGQVRTVTDYVASTHVVTVATWTVNPDSTSVVTWALPSPLDKWGDLVAMGAAIRMCARRRDTETANRLREDYAADLSDMMSSLVSRQTDQPRHINYISDGSEW